jgi:MFS family permease
LLFGLSTFPIYSLSAAHANDFAMPDDVLDLSASLIFFYALGAIISPIIAGYFIGIFGTSYLFIHISLAHIVLMAFTVIRAIARPVSADDKPYVYYPRTTMFIANIIRARNAEDKRNKD